MDREPLPSTQLRSDPEIRKAYMAGEQLSHSEWLRWDMIKGSALEPWTVRGGQTGMRQQPRRRVW
jgi:hypothetical protein